MNADATFYAELRAFAREIVLEAGQLTQHYFRQGVSVETKSDQSPVTVADREAELLLRKRIEERYPDHGIIGEEHGRTRENAEYVWVLDPIDGTRSFVNGIPLYTNLIGVLRNGEPVAGVINAPAMDECVEASAGGGCLANGEPTHIREVERPLALTSSTGTLHALQPEFCRVFLERYPYHRTWADGYGYLMVATGRAQVMVDAVLEIWDAAPMPVIIAEAGGVYTDWRGTNTVHSRTSIAATPVVHEQVLGLAHHFGRVQ